MLAETLLRFIIVEPEVAVFVPECDALCVADDMEAEVLIPRGRPAREEVIEP